jgi:hypothetical protein
MPKRDEIQAVLDTLYLSKNLHWDAEQSMWHEAKSKMDYTPFDKLRGRKPSRYPPGWAKSKFDERFWDLVELALEHAEKVRKGKNAIEVYPLSACVVDIQRDHWGVELYLGKFGTYLVDGFTDWIEAERWAKYKSKEFLREKGVPDEASLIIIGKDYY